MDLMNVVNPFKKTHFLESRLKESSKIISKYPDRVPVIVQKSKNANDATPTIDKVKFLVPKDFSFSQFMVTIRDRIKLNQDQALFCFYDNNTFPNAAELMGVIYDRMKDEDGFLHLSYISESTFG